MFTGLVQDLGTVTCLRRGERGAMLTIATALAADVELGDSVAVNGACLTASRVGDGEVDFEVMNESLRRTSLGDLSLGATVNLELALRADQRLGGHVVSGHVDAVGTVRDVAEDGFARVLTIAVPRDQLRYVVEKGSICVDGVSLTVVAVDDETLTVSLIPETLARTTLGALCDAPAGRTVNLEVDVMAKHVEKLVSAALDAAVEDAVERRLSGSVSKR